ncbi:cytochrome P450 [Guillardia theta CCMP2712]|uniref:Cytochrome P450 n=2 Tax=Guillardia theta TaxID=55529 RepID=L1ISD3_GUITC|nr:cytochrome P450 [Guillardia theta CCMP2712]EKX39181.1 cytochrome P450 [Guillardia theta CCMP2712]|eukprot:XP_005826161.1 cytochrome P450 [Guillardia theta CCMP2712]
MHAAGMARRAGFLTLLLPVLSSAFLTPSPNFLASSLASKNSRVHQVGRRVPRLSLRMQGPKLDAEVFGKDRLKQEEADIRKMEKQGMAKKDVTLTDIISLWITNIILTYGDKEKYAQLQDGAVKSEGVVDDLVGGPLFLPLYKYFKDCGGLYKLCFGPKVFMVASDPLVIRHIMKDNVFSYDKGVLTEILEPFMGQGLIPAPFQVWKERRRALVPGFHQAWLNRMCRMFSECTDRLSAKLDAVADTDEIIDMEENWNSCSLDIIGKAVFNYDFGSVEKLSPVVEAALCALREAEHRSTFYFPYWKIPGLGAEWPIPALVPRQRKFQQDMALLNGVLDKLILNVVNEKQETDLDALINKDYDNVNDPSLLRFLVDLRGADATQKQLRDDLITLLIAGHETTGSMLTWATWLLSQHPEAQAKMQKEIDDVLGGRSPTYEDMPRLEQVRLVITETLRLFPEPPILIRRALDADVLPKASNLDGSVQGNAVKIIKGSDFFLSVWNLHRSPLLWDKPDEFDPDRWRRPTPPELVEKYNAQRRAEGLPEWQGYVPDLKTLYPNEVHADYAFLPFGAGPRKCLGDQFALMESVVMLTKIFQRYSFELVGNHDPKVPNESDVGMMFGATIHTANGLNVRVKRRQA